MGIGYVYPKQILLYIIYLWLEGELKNKYYFKRCDTSLYGPDIYGLEVPLEGENNHYQWGLNLKLCFAWMFELIHTQ